MKQLHEVHAPTPMKLEQSERRKTYKYYIFPFCFFTKLSNKERGYNGRRYEGVVMFVHN